MRAFVKQPTRAPNCSFSLVPNANRYLARKTGQMMECSGLSDTTQHARTRWRTSGTIQNIEKALDSCRYSRDALRTTGNLMKATRRSSHCLREGVTLVNKIRQWTSPTCYTSMAVGFIWNPSMDKLTRFFKDLLDV